MGLQVYNLKVKYENSHELLQAFIKLYSVCNNINDSTKHLRARLAQVLSYYILKGYSSETKNFILKSHPDIKREHLNQINAELQKKGYLKKDKYNENKREVKQSILDLKKYLEEAKHPIIAITFKEVE